MARIYYSLYDRLLHEERFHAAFRKVKGNKGAPGIDGQTVEAFAERLGEEVATLVQELREKSYRPMPVKRVEIDKPDGGKRKLGIPAVRDRVVQQALLDILQPVFDPEFHPDSYGYRPGKSAQQAVARTVGLIREEGRRWAVDLDLSKCFDTLDHAIIIRSFRRRVADGSILGLIRQFLQSGVMVGGAWEASEEGSPQGGVISPLISNVYLDAFDRSMSGRGHRVVRYADDILILTSSRTGAEKALVTARKHLEGELKLTVNEAKSCIVSSNEGIKFLGVVLRTQQVLIREERLRGLKEKLRKLTRRNSPVNLGKVISDLNPVIRGFATYFRMADCKGVFKSLAQWIRRRLRAKQLKLWKTPKRLHRRLRQLGYSGEFQKIKMSSWRNSGSPLAHYAMPNAWLMEMGLYDLEKVAVGLLSPRKRG
jgi:group II intron reverse transcriptase/maturase